MGLVHLATFRGGILWEFHVGKYTFRPMDPMVIIPPSHVFFAERPLWKALKNPQAGCLEACQQLLDVSWPPSLH